MMQGQHFLKATLRYYFIVKSNLNSNFDWQSSQLMTYDDTNGPVLKYFALRNKYFCFSPEQTGGGCGGQ